MIGSVVEGLVANDTSKPVNITGFDELTKDQQRVVVASSVTFLMGIFQVEYIYIKSTSISFRLSHFSDDIKITPSITNIIRTNC